MSVAFSMGKTFNSPFNSIVHIISKRNQRTNSWKGWIFHFWCAQECALLRGSGKRWVFHKQAGEYFSHIIWRVQEGSGDLAPLNWMCLDELVEEATVCPVCWGKESRFSQSSCCPTFSPIKFSLGSWITLVQKQVCELWRHCPSVLPILQDTIV